ncbi:MAG: hypothetical protein ACI9OJ_005039 [Myxococcota bacterium]|jgi:hypothetical protein
MEKTAAGWNVIDRAAGVLSINYEFTKGAGATTFAARMTDGKMVIVSPSVGLNDAIASDLAEFGDVGAIVANNGFHHLGQAEWRARYPKARAFAPAMAAARIAKKSKTAGEFEPLEALAPLLGTDVGFHDVENSKLGESWFWAKVDSGYAYYVSDVLANMPSLPPALMPKFLFWLTKSGPGYSVFHLALKFMVKDKSATLNALLADMEMRVPSVVVPGHGPMLTEKDIASKTRDIIKAAL